MGPAHRLTWTHSLGAPAPGRQIERHGRHTGRNWSVQHQGESWGGSFLPGGSAGRGHWSFSEPSPPHSHRASGRVSYLRLHQSSSHCLPWPGDSRPCLSQLLGPPKLFPVAFQYKWLVLAHASDFPKFSQTSSVWLQGAPYISLSCPRPSSSSNQPWFTDWPHLAPPSPAWVAATWSSLCRLSSMTPDRTQAVADLGCANSNQGSTTQRVYTAYRVGTPWVPSLGNRGGCATGPHRIPTTLSYSIHPIKPGKHSSST